MNYHYTTEITFGVDEIDYEIEIEYSYRAGHAGIMWGDNACPPEGPEIEIVGATILSPTVGGKPSPEMMAYIQADKDHYYRLAEDGAANDRDARAEAAEYRAESRRDFT